MRKGIAALLPVVLAFWVGAVPALAWTWPADGPVLEHFAIAENPYQQGQHRGIDVGVSPGDPVLAPASGVVSFAGFVPDGGRTLTILTDDGYAVTLLHLGAIEVSEGERVLEGARVATAGSSGIAEHPEPSLHLGIRRASEEHGYVDPLSLLPPRAGDGQAATPQQTEPGADESSPSSAIPDGDDSPAEAPQAAPIAPSAAPESQHPALVEASEARPAPQAASPVAKPAATPGLATDPEADPGQDASFSDAPRPAVVPVDPAQPVVADAGALPPVAAASEVGAQAESVRGASTPASGRPSVAGAAPGSPAGASPAGLGGSAAVSDGQEGGAVPTPAFVAGAASERARAGEEASGAAYATAAAPGGPAAASGAHDAGEHGKAAQPHDLRLPADDRRAGPSAALQAIAPDALPVPAAPGTDGDGRGLLPPLSIAVGLVTLVAGGLALRRRFGSQPAAASPAVPTEPLGGLEAALPRAPDGPPPPVVERSATVPARRNPRPNRRGGPERRPAPIRRLERRRLSV